MGKVAKGVWGGGRAGGEVGGGGEELEAGGSALRVQPVIDRSVLDQIQLRLVNTPVTHSAL